MRAATATFGRTRRSTVGKGPTVRHQFSRARTGRVRVVDEKNLLALLTTLPQKKQLAFALLIFERLLPRLTAFCKDTGVDCSCCLKAQEAAWSALETGGKRSALYRSLNKACLNNAPDTEDFTHELTSDALNAFLAVSEIMQFALDGSFDHIAYVSTLAKDSVFLYVGDLEPALVTTQERVNWISAHPLMQQELRRQEEDIRFLAALPSQFDEEIVSAIRARASSQPPILPLAS